MVAGDRSGYLAPMNSAIGRFAILCLMLTVALIALATSGCQTSKGFGKDVEKLGDKIQEKSK
ncbi:Entericidin EcnA/B family protein [Opitutus sp. GAS368]|jgi:predicted small secreted protein|nr:Entericidin EcnA/B family protein [Opitutus sp. GAS368]